MVGHARHVLVIEDDAATAEQLVDCLKSSSYAVDLAVDGEDGLRRALAADYVVMTVDRMVPGIDGIEIIRRLKEQGVLTPALILSALGEINDRVRGLRAGGDDYLVKPFAFREMLARRSATVVKETMSDPAPNGVNYAAWRYGNNCSPVSASSTKIALTGQFSAASRIFSTVSPAGSTASD